MVRIIVDSVPADIKVIIFPLFFSLLSFGDFTISCDTTLHITIDTIAVIKILSPPVYYTKLLS